MSADPIAETLGALWSPLLAVTTHHQGRDNGLVAGTGVFASLVPEAPRVAPVTFGAVSFTLAVLRFRRSARLSAAERTTEGHR